MHTTHRTPTITAAQRPVADIDADLLVIPVFDDDSFTDLPGLALASGGEVGGARARGAFVGKLFDVLAMSTEGTGWKTPRAALVGAGPRAACTPDRIRRIAIIGGLMARRRRLTRLAIVTRTGTAVTPDTAAQVAAEGATIANYDGGSFKTEDHDRTFLASVEVNVPVAAGPLAAAVDRGGVLGDATNQARAFSNEPPNHLTPRLFAERAVSLAEAAGLKTDILDEARIDALKMGLLMGVARGSHEPPRLVVLRHDPPDAPAGVVLGLVGKGVTFDTGGISIKPADNMDKMKDDMSGGAAVIAAMVAIARLKAPVRCLGIVPMTENMPGGKAIKPGDVLTSAEGKTVEVINTDAEGRLVLGDALWYARQLGATHLVDVATLTGAAVVALGRTTSGLFGTPAAWVEQVRQASDRAGDRSWAMPVFEDYREQLHSEIADFTNTGGRAGGAITGALFIKEFSGGLPWVHMDIAGTAWAEEEKAYQPKGATGVAVRTLVELALAGGAWTGTASDV